MKRSANRRSDRGYALIYILAILVFVTAVVVEQVRNSRRAMQVAGKLQQWNTTAWRLGEAGNLLRVRLQYVWDEAKPAERRLEGLIARVPSELSIDGETVTLAVVDADLRPDANSLSGEEWQRLLQAYGASAQEARAAAARIDALRRERGGFTNINELSGLNELPQALLDGDGPERPPLVDLLSIGGGRRLHASQSPLVLFAVLAGVGEGALARLSVLRQRGGKLAAGDLELVLGPEARGLVHADAPVRLAVLLSRKGQPQRIEFDIKADTGKLVFGLPRHVILGRPAE